MCKDLDQSRPADWYKLKSLVFGVCSYPYQAKFVWQKLAKENKKRYPKQLRRSWSPLTWMTALTHPQPQRSVYSSKKNYQHCRGFLSGFMPESGFQAQNKFSRKNQRSTREITSHNFNFIREVQQEAFQKEYKALVSSTQTLSWTQFTCMT